MDQIAKTRRRLSRLLRKRRDLGYGKAHDAAPLELREALDECYETLRTQIKRAKK